MIPVGAFIGAYFAVRALSQRSASTGLPPQTSSAGVRLLARWAVATAILIPAALAGGWAGFFIVLPILVALVWTDLLVDGVLVPLGVARPAWALHCVLGSTPTFSEEPAAEQRPRAAFVGARAYLRRRNTRDARFLERYLNTCVELATTGAAAAALLALGRGQVDLASRVFHVLLNVKAQPLDRRAARIATEFVVLEAASRGDWQGVLHRTSREVHSSRLTRLVAAMARRALGYPARGLWLYWILAPRPWATRAILATLRPPQANLPPHPVQPNLAALSALLARTETQVRAGDVAAAVASLDALRASTFLVAEVARRGLALGTLGSPVDAEGIRERLVVEAEEDLASFLLNAHLPTSLVPPGPCGDRIRAQVAEARVARVEALVAELERRKRERVDLPEVEEWAAWGDLRAACEEAFADARELASARAIFDVLYSPVTSYGVRLANVRSIRVLAREIFAYLGKRAAEIGVSDAEALMQRNAAGCATDRLPFQEALAGEVLHDAECLGRWRRWNQRLTLILFLAVVFVMPGAAWVISATVPSIGLIAIGSAVVLRIVFTRHNARLVEASWTEDGLVLQTPKGRYYAAPADLRKVASNPWSTVRIALRRAPRWLPRTCEIPVASAAKARKLTRRLRALLPGS